MDVYKNILWMSIKGLQASINDTAALGQSTVRRHTRALFIVVVDVNAVYLSFCYYSPPQNNLSSVLVVVAVGVLFLCLPIVVVLVH